MLYGNYVYLFFILSLNKKKCHIIMAQVELLKRKKKKKKTQRKYI